MKKILTFSLLLLSVAFMLPACKKDKNANSNYYVKFKVNGTWVTWTNVLGELGPDLADGSKTNLGVTAQNDNNTETLDITLQMDGPSIATGSYNSDQHTLFYLYAIDLGTTLEGYTISTADGREDSKYTLNVTSITDEEIRGNFTGNYLFDTFDDKLLEITEGEFVVRRIR